MKTKFFYRLKFYKLNTPFTSIDYDNIQDALVQMKISLRFNQNGIPSFSDIRLFTVTTKKQKETLLG